MAGKAKFDYSDPVFIQKMWEIYPQRGGSKILRDMFGICESTICTKAKILGIVSDQNTRLQFYYDSKINGHFETMLREWVPVEGGVTRLTEIFGVVSEIIRIEAEKIGICSLNAQKKRRHKISLRKDFFLNWDEVVAYYIGYIWADGSIVLDSTTKKPVGLGLYCKRDDEQIILQLRDLLGSDHSVNRGVRYNKDGSVVLNKDGRPREYTNSLICSTELAESLIEYHGILPNKSYLDLPFPTNIPEDLLCHFARGYFDGDGCCGLYKYDYEYGSVTKNILYYMGTNQFIHGLKEKILSCVPVASVTPQLNGNSWYIQWQGLQDIEFLYYWMYPNPDVVCLKRKRVYLEKMLAGEVVLLDEEIPEFALEA